MTTVVFQTAVLMEAVRAAAKIAPTKAGSAFDRAAGLIIEINIDENDPTKAEALVRATDTDVFFSKWVPILEIQGDETVWRLPSMHFSGAVERLRSVSGGTVTLSENGSRVELKSGRTRAEFSLMKADDFPNWELLDKEFESISNLGPAIKSVIWACDSKATTWMGGVVVLPEYVMATNRYRIARYPVSIPGLQDEGIVLPASVAKVIADLKGDVKFYSDGMNAWFMPDDDTQIRTVLIQEVPSKTITSIFTITHNEAVSFEAGDVNSLIDLIGVITDGERGVNRMRMWVGKGELAAMSTNEEIGRLRDIVDLPNQADHGRVEIHIDPQNFALAISNGEGGGKVTMHYRSDIPYINVPQGQIRERILKFTKDTGYAAWVVPATG